MDEKQVAWIGDFGGAAVEKENFEKRELAKAAAMELIRKRLEGGKREELAGVFDEFEVSRGGKRVGSMVDMGGDQLEEVDRTELDAPIDDVDWSKSAGFERALSWSQQNADYLASLTVEVTGPDGTVETVPMFTEEEITEEFYFPLVRERLLPDSIVPDPYSKTQKMIAATDALYDEAIAKAKKDGGLTEDWDPIQSFASKGAKLATAAGDFAGEFSGADADTAKDVLGLVALTLETTATLRDASKKANDQIKGVADAIGNMTAKIIEMSGNKEAAQAFHGGWKVGAATGDIINRMQETPPDWEGIVTSFGDGIGEAFSLANKDGDPVIRKVGVAISTAIKSGPTVKKIAKALKDGNYSAAAEGLLSIAESGANAFLSEKIEDDSTLTDEQKEAANADSEERNQAIGEALNEMREAAAALARAQEADAALEDMRADSAENFARDASSIDVLIKKMEKDAAILQMAAKVSQGGTAILAKFVPALGGASAAAKFVFNLMAAAQRATDMNAWMKNQGDLQASVNSLSAASKNFVHNQKEQFAHYTIQAALDVAVFVGEMLKLGGVTAAAGSMVATSASALQTVEEVIYDMNRELNLEAAWKLTVQARENPRNRRLALRARSMNPTLAKYCMAWGAVVKKDSMARTAMSACGLNETTLQSRDANAHKVVKYLETYFADDQTLVREIPATPDWAPGKVELTPKFWVITQTRGEKEGGLKPSSTGKISGLLATFGKAKKDVESLIGVPVVNEAIKEFEEVAGELEKALESYAPVQVADDGAHVPMLAVVEELLELVTREIIWAGQQHAFSDEELQAKFADAAEGEESGEARKEREALEKKMADQLADRVEREQAEAELARREEEKHLVAAMKMLKSAQAKTKGALGGKLKSIPYVYYPNVKVKDGRYETGPLLCVNETASTFRDDPFTLVEGEIGRGLIVAKGIGTASRKKYFKFQGISQAAMFEALKQSGWSMKNLKAKEDLEVYRG